jgi:hypothetical protein
MRAWTEIKLPTLALSRLVAGCALSEIQWFACLLET